MPPTNSLPLPKGFNNPEEYVKELLHFVTSSDLFKLLVGGVHILDFFVRSPDLYEWLIDEDWRSWFELHDISTLLDFILREDLVPFANVPESPVSWRGKRAPPESLVNYLSAIRNLSLVRELQFSTNAVLGDVDAKSHVIPRHTSSGMNVKKIHEVSHFASYVHELTKEIAVIRSHEITHLVDFGAGQAYLGRTLASPPYNKHVIAVESKPHNIAHAKGLDIFARVTPKPVVKVNKKLFRAEQERQVKALRENDGALSSQPSETDPKTVKGASAVIEAPNAEDAEAQLHDISSTAGSIQYVHHKLEDGNLASIIGDLVIKSSITHQASKEPSTLNNTHGQPNLLVLSLHSCGNLSHHGLRSLILNPSVSAVCLIGCCYNLVTERLSPPSHKLPSLRRPPRSPSPIDLTSGDGDPHGFPMSTRLCNHPTVHGHGVHFNITARMMAVQAPLNWSAPHPGDFFTRHHFRALLQKLFLDRGVVEAPSASSAAGDEDYGEYVVGGHIADDSDHPSSQPITIGSLRKNSYASFTSYVRGALSKLASNSHLSDKLKPNSQRDDRAKYLSNMIDTKLSSLTDAKIQAYETAYASRQKDLSIVWTLMAYSAGLVEAVMVVDRWLWLREQEEVGECWVEAVFEYGRSPRNLVVVGIKK